MTGGQIIPMPGMPVPMRPPAQQSDAFATDTNIQQNFMAALAILKDPTQRKFRIDIESDSMIVIDEQAEKQARVEFLTGVGNFLTAALPIAQASPQMMPLLMEMLLFGVRGFRAGRDLETAFEEAKQAMGQQASRPKPPPPEQVKAQADAAASQQAMQLQQAKGQSDLSIKQVELQIKQIELQVAQIQAQADVAKVQAPQQQDPNADAERMLKLAQALKTQREADSVGAQTQQMVGANDAIANSEADRQHLAQTVQQMLTNAAPQMSHIADALNQHAAMMHANHQAVQAQLAQMGAPKNVQFMRGPDGRIAGAQVT